MKRSVRWLFGSWFAYWAILALVRLGPMVLAIWRVANTADSNSNSVSFNVSNLTLNVIVLRHGQTTWSGSTTFVALAVWIGLVPLAIWLAWFMAARADAPVKQSA